MKRVRTLFISACVLTSIGVSAQTVSGKLMDENSQPLPYANVVLLSLPDSAFVSGGTSDDKGNFFLKDLSSRSYLLQVSYIGYQPQFILLEKGPQHSVTYRIPKKCVSIWPPYSAKRRKQQVEDARIHGLPFDEKEKNDDEDFQMG